MTGREVKSGRSAPATRAFAKPDHRFLIGAAAHGKHSMRDMVIAIHRAWNTVRGEIAKGLKNAPSLH